MLKLIKANWMFLTCCTLAGAVMAVNSIPGFEGAYIGAVPFLILAGMEA